MASSFATRSASLPSKPPSNSFKLSSIAALRPFTKRRCSFTVLAQQQNQQQQQKIEEKHRKLEQVEQNRSFKDSARVQYTSESDEAIVESWEDELKLMLGENKWNEFKKSGAARDKDWLRAQIDRRSVDNIRMLIVDCVNNAKAGHPGLPLGMAEVGYTLYRRILRYNPSNPSWFNRDRFVLSAGHGCLLQYICLHLAGFQSVQIEDLKKLCKLGGRTPGHPENTMTAGIEVTTGPLGQGTANAVGLALAERHLAARFNKPGHTIIDHRTFCIMGDGCAMEGISNEAASLAGHWKLDKLTFIYDDNHNTIDGDTKIAFTEDVAARYRALGWQTLVVENIYDHPEEFEHALEAAFKEKEKPSFIQVKSCIGKPSKNQGTHKAHHGVFDDEDVKNMRKELNWTDKQSFHVIPALYEEFQRKGNEGQCLEEEWELQLAKYEEEHPAEGAAFRQLLDGSLPADLEKHVPTWKSHDPVDATRGYSLECLNALAKVLPGLIGGSADLASSNKVQLKGQDDFQHFSPWGRNIRYGVREHAMAGISNGIALHASGLIPFAATFLTFSDYMKNSIRLSALSDAGVIYICTHDSIGVGEDGPTHQPVEHLVGLRAVPNLLVFRPADGNETSGAYLVAARRRNGPSLIALSRQKVQAQVAGTSPEKVSKGGYIVSDNTGDGEQPELVLIGTGTELCLCEDAAERLRNDGHRVRVVSLVCWELFDEQGAEYKEAVLPRAAKKRMSVEAGSPIGWREYVGDEGKVMGVSRFGKSGAYLDVFQAYGFNVDNVERQARELLR